MKEHVKAYIAGFLDGDGSLMLQIKQRKRESRYGYRIQATICFYQKSDHDAGLEWIRDQIGLGYLSHRNDGMSELQINGFEQVKSVLQSLEPYIVFKKSQVKILLAAVAKLETCSSPMEFLEICRLCDQLAACNYKARRKRTADCVEHDFLQRKLLYPRND